MPPLAQAQVKPTTNDLKVKKTKSRNGCARCKLKRLKCDETAPGCLQCKRRNVACPGYEKTLKWSTKYEVFQPTLFAPAPHKYGSTATVTKASPKEKPMKVTPDVERHFEALAAVLPAGKQTAEPTNTNTHQQSPPPMAVGSLTSSEDSTPEPSDGSPPEMDPLPEPLFFEDPIDFDPLMMDGLVDVMGMPEDDLSFGPLDGFDIEPGPSECVNYNGEVLQQPANEEASSSPRLSRSLLLDFYRLPSPSPSATTADDIESVLIQHYFKEVCGRFSCFDSHLNPFRTTISRIYQQTPSIYYGIMSMSAAHLTNTFPYMAQLGLDMQRKARDALLMELPLAQNDPISQTKVFLSTMLLGTTTGWHDSDILGEEFLSAARSLILPKLLNHADGAPGKQRETQFFEESIIYWEMLMGFVNPNAMTFAPSGLRSRPKKIPSARKPDGKIMPHPWTGIAPTIMILFAEVGRLVRRERMRDGNASIDFRRHHENLLNAATLEEDLLAAEYPSVDEIAELDDEQTSKQDFVAVAEAYRCAGLLEIYSVFPSILRKRLGAKKSDSGELADFKSFPMPRFETSYEDTDTKLWLNSLAMHILDLIDSVPSSSGTICIQHILIVSAASELRFVSSVDFFDVYANDTKVCQSREFAVKRLQEFSRRLPAKPFRKMIDLIKEVWRRQDNGDNVFWVDVIDEQGYKFNPFVR
ncbi:uncharacterized protein N0V89_002026 [Didymosphaeria variabile]|uniref:Zn(2)-C6 fungal-type domain-containing protein n=1 Tax=Didymosphaeria variabile TaxID=1932322 RepID=A0A9W8XRC1_9PLEO|nr:uncharacterized protein N0V89_002026 [Didymosphaeria variabile]KAJ4357451.1 hypothetical protein N0V89_002026 [Didymosphaeria variabile]